MSFNFNFIFLAFFAIKLHFSYANYIATPIAITKSGEIVGSVKTLTNGNKINEYLGIPYAQPPINDLRFKKPIPVKPWTKRFEAIDSRDSCMQLRIKQFEYPVVGNMSEDCLFLNIWTPNGQSKTEEKELLPVMFWIYGGGLNVGGIFIDVYNASYLSSLGDVIVVSTNYRLGHFGFLYGGNDEMPGNMGFHDQLLALKWVKNNIGAFGGDASSITIFGESAGGSSVSAMVLSPLTKGLFKRAIIQSGTTNGVFGSESKERSLDYTKILADSLNCTGSSLSEKIACLKSKSAEELKYPLSIQNAKAIYGDEYLPLKPSEALKQGKMNSVDLLFGHVKNEGSTAVIPFTKDINVFTIDFAKSFITSKFNSMKLTYGKKVADLYINGLKNEDKIGLVQAVAASLGDFLINCPTVLFGSSVAKWNVNNTAYAYVLGEPPTHSFVGKDVATNWRGVCHGDDVLYLFGAPLRDGREWPEKDKQMSKDFIKVWTTFAKTGNVPFVGSKSWTQAIDRNVTNPHIKYMELSRQPCMIEHGYEKTCEGFWKPIIEA